MLLLGMASDVQELAASPVLGCIWRVAMSNEISETLHYYD